MLVPLYLMVQQDLKLPGVASVSWIVTIYGCVYFAGSYAAGILADRFNRKALLGIGLVGNAVAILLMGVTRDYHAMIALAVLAGVAGTLFHPAANAMIPAHYPKNPGMAIGLLGIGAGIGFWAGPQYAGWRAETATWTLFGLSNWQRPLVEAGAAGLAIGVIFLLIAKETHVAAPGGGGQPRPVRQSLGRSLTLRTLAVAMVLGCRDMAGVATLSLMSIFLLKAHQLDTKQVGFILGTMMLSAALVNPLAVYFTPGRRRLPAFSIMLLVAGLIIAFIPFVPLWAVLPVMCTYFGFQLGSYAVGDAAIIERITPSSRGRVVGIFLTWAGTFSSSGPWIVGHWTDAMGVRALDPHAYTLPFLAMSALLWIAACSSPLIARLGKPGTGPTPDPITETTPATMTAVG